MPRYLAIEWDDHELRALVANSTGRTATVERADAIALVSEEGRDPTPEAIGKTLAQWCREQGVTRCSTLVAVGRASIELKRLSLPPSPDNELPEMVRFQAQREFTSLSEESPLDFLPLAGSDTTPRQVLAAALSPELLNQIRVVCDTAHLRAERIVLRPCATTAVVRQAGSEGTEEATLIVDPLLDEVDLSVLVDGKPAFIRTLRLPHVTDDERQFRPLMGELRRTIAAFQNQFREVRIASITVCGDPEQRAAMAEAIGSEFNLPTHVINPLEVAGTANGLKNNLPDHPGRFAPLVGMVLDEVAGSHAIDFLNPRRKVEQRTSHLTYILAAAAVLLVLGWYGWWQWDRIAEKKLAVQTLREQIRKEQEFANSLNPVKERAARLGEWERSDVNLLGEFRELSLALRPLPLDAEDFPADDDVVATDLTLKSAASGGEINLDAVAKNRSITQQVQQRIRADEWDTSSIGPVKYEEARPGYRWRFNLTERITRTDSSETGETQP